MDKLKKELEAVKYHELKDRFTDLGIPQVWKPGTKKAIIIQNALELLEKLESKNIGASENDGEQNANIVEDAILEIETEHEVIFQEKQVEEKSFFENSVLKIVEQKDLWTIDSMKKRINIYENVFKQHRGMDKGAETLLKQQILSEALKRIFKK